MQNLPNPAICATPVRIRPGEAARMLGVTPRTLSTMSELHPFLLPSGHRRYLRSEVEALVTSSAPDTGEEVTK